MKRLGKVFLGILCIIFLFAFSHASAENICDPSSDDKNKAEIEPKKTVTFEWVKSDTYLNGNPIDEKDFKVYYQVYVKKQEIGEDPPHKELNNYKYGDVIDSTSCKIELANPGIYNLGVQALLFRFKDGRRIGNSINESKISWSCDRNCTPNKPRYVNVKN